jgi:hypothetical protein
MARNTAEVLLGTGFLYTAPVGEAAPTNPTTAIAGNWEDVGYSEDGWNLVFDLTFEYFTPAELADPIATMKTAQEGHLRGVAAQGSLENLQLALGGGTIVTAAGPPETKTYTAPESTGFDFFSLLFRGNAPELTPGVYGVRDVYVPRAISASSVDMAHTKGANPSMIALDFRFIKEDATDLFTIKETTDLP